MSASVSAIAPKTLKPILTTPKIYFFQIPKIGFYFLQKNYCKDVDTISSSKICYKHRCPEKCAFSSKKQYFSKLSKLQAKPLNLFIMAKLSPTCLFGQNTRYIILKYFVNFVVANKFPKISFSSYINSVNVSNEFDDIYV